MTRCSMNSNCVTASTVLCTVRVCTVQRTHCVLHSAYPAQPSRTRAVAEWYAHGSKGRLDSVTFLPGPADTTLVDDRAHRASSQFIPNDSTPLHPPSDPSPALSSHFALYMACREKLPW